MPLQSIETTSTTSTFSSPGHPSPQEFQKQLHGQSSLNSEVGPSARRTGERSGWGYGCPRHPRTVKKKPPGLRSDVFFLSFFLVHMNDGWSMDRWLETSWDPLKLMPATLPPWLSLADRQMWRASEGPIVGEGVSIQGPSDLGASVSVSHGFMSLVQQNRWLHWHTLAKDGWGNPVYPLMFRGILERPERPSFWRCPKS